MRAFVPENVQYCANCRAEFQGWVTVCSDCGGALQRGAMAETGESARRPLQAAAAAAPAPADELLAELSGTPAHYLSQALAMEGIASVLECEGILQFHGPGRPEQMPLAATLPVAVHVAHGDLARAQDILQSITEEGQVLDPWSVAVDDVALDTEALKDSTPDTPVALAAAVVVEPPRPDAVVGRVLILLVAAVVLMFALIRP